MPSAVSAGWDIEMRQERLTVKGAEVIGHAADRDAERLGDARRRVGAVRRQQHPLRPQRRRQCFHIAAHGL